MSTPTLILGNNKWAIEEDNILGYAVEDRNGSYLPREISFTRGSDATYTDSTGVIQQACWNLLQYSEQFDNIYWAKIASSVVTDTTISPGGSTTADTITENTSTGRHFAYASITTIAGTTYSASVYVKNLSRRYVTISLKNVSLASPVYSATFDLDSGINTTTFSAGTPLNTSNFITSVGNGWYRIGISMQAVSASTYLEIGLSNSATPSYSEGMATYTGDGTSALYYWGAQLVTGTQPLDYIRTTDRLNMPRVDSSTGTKTFLLEPQRTNLALWSDDFSNAIYSKYQATVTTNATTSPDGTTNADKIIATAVTAEHYALQNINTTISLSYTYSIYLKASEYTWAKIATNTPGSAVGAFFNLSTGVVGTIDAGVTASIQSVGNGWYRCIITTTSNSTALKYFVVWPTINGSSIVYTGDGASGIFSYGFQVEQGAYPTTYIPTQATTVTRIADSTVKTGISSLIGQSSGTLFVSAIPNLNTSFIPNVIIRTLFTDVIAVGFIDNKVSVWIRISNSGFLTLYTSTTVYTTGSIVKIALKYTSTSYNLFINGTSVSSLSTSMPSSFDTLSLNGDGAFFSIGRVFNQQIALFTTALSDADCQTLTTL